MLVLKRALSLMLSFVLAEAPTLAFARDTQPAKSHRFKAVSPDAYNREQAAQEKKSRGQVEHSKKKSPTASNGTSAKTKSVDGAIAMMYRPVHYRGQDYTITQLPGAKGKRARAQMIRGKDFNEILVDEHGTGTASLWEVTRGNLQVKASHPYKGAFSQVDVREKRAKAFVNVHLQINPDLKTYRVASYQVEPLKPDHYTNNGEIRLQCVSQLDDDSSRNGITTLDEILTKISIDGMSSSTALSCKMNHYQEALFDKSCFKGEFAGSASDMAEGLAKIFSSVDPKHTGKPRYLQCLNEMGFAYNSAQMQAHFVDNRFTAEKNFNTATNRPADAPVPGPDDCSVLDKVDIYKGGQKSGIMASLLDLIAPGTHKPFKCDSKIPNPAEYDPDTGQVQFKMGAAEIAKKFNGSAADGYAELEFHELLHQSGLTEGNNEKLVENLEHCCASPNPDSPDAVNNCNQVQAFKQQVLTRELNQTQLGIYMPGYAGMLSSAKASMGENKAQAMMDKWFTALQSDTNASKAWNDLQNCAQANAAVAVSCNEAALPALKKFNDSFFDKKSSSEKQDYSSLRTSFDSAMESGAKLTTQVPVEIATGQADHYGEEVVQTRSLAVTADSVASDASAIASSTAIPSSGVITITDGGTAVAPKDATPINPTAVTKGGKARTRGAVARSGGGGTTVVTINDPAPAPSQPKVNLVVDDSSGSAAQPASRPAATSSTAIESTGSTGGGDSGGVSTAPIAQSSGSSNSSGSGDAGQTSASQGSAGSGSSIGSSGSTNAAVPSYVPSSKPTAATSAMLSSSKPMPALSTAGAVPASSDGGAKLDPGTANSIQTAQSLTNTFANAGQGLVNGFVNAVSGTALASQVAQARSPASVAVQPTSSGSLGARTASSASAASGASFGSARGGSLGDNEDGSSGKDKSKQSKRGVASDKASSDDQQDQSNEKDGAVKDYDSRPTDGDPRTGPSDPHTTAAIANFETLKSARPEVVWRKLFDLGPETLVRELNHGDSSRVVRTLKANGWTVRTKNSSKILVNPAGKCYAPDPRRTLVPLATCG